jgi:hypothetical protein
MVLAQDVRTQSGVLLAARGYQVTRGFVERAHNLREKLGRTISVIVRERVGDPLPTPPEEVHTAARQ